MKTPRKTPRPDNTPWDRVARAACAGLAGQALQACVAAQQTVAPAYPSPPSLECPRDAVRTMEDTLHIPITYSASVTFRPRGDYRGLGRMDVRQSATVQLIEPLGKLEDGTVLTGRLFFTADRIHGLFTEAKTEDGTTYPVCLELKRESTPWEEPGGTVREDIGGPADSAVIFSTQAVRAVRRFPNKP